MNGPSCHICDPSNWIEVTLKLYRSGSSWGLRVRLAMVGIGSQDNLVIPKLILRIGILFFTTFCHFFTLTLANFKVGTSAPYSP